MLIFDQLKKSDPKLRLLAVGVFCGMLILLAGLWYVQVVASRHYVENLKNQTFRTVRIPAIRGKILDRHGVPLAENRPSYNINLYLDELREVFQAEYRRRRPNRPLTCSEITELARTSRYSAFKNTADQVSTLLQLPVTITERQFHQHYDQRLALPLTIAAGLNHQQVARFQEKSVEAPGLDLEIQPVRVYPFKSTTAHLLGYLRRDDSSNWDEEASFNYRLPDYKGVVGIEGALDQELRGRAGVKSVLVNNLGYRQSETIWTAADPGQNVHLTIDLKLQQAAESALRHVAPEVRGAAIVMDAASGDILALVSAPSYDANTFIPSVSPADYEKLMDPTQRPMINRATQGVYAPGSIFKIIVALAALENGLDPHATYHVETNPTKPPLGCIYVGSRKIEDTAKAGPYDLRRAFARSSNAYFIHYGLISGIDSILRLGERLHLGEKAGLPLYQESAGLLPTRAWQRRERGGSWFDGDTANICIGQGDLAVTPMQMAVMTAAIANGGKVLWPRLVDRLEPPDSLQNQPASVYSSARVREELKVQPRHLQTIKEVMFADVEDTDGTAFNAFHELDRQTLKVPGMRIGGKTGTAQVTQGRKVIDHITWFVSFGELNGKNFVVVVVVESGGSGGTTCAPVAQKIYKEIHRLETDPRVRPPSVASLTP